ncbi:cytochrome c oxidase assembly protein COX11, mitochondrial [Trichogramma pretiosum]|uniref:cytochrome c oxidase assembly protein COX11, mitochondrial n=1 Tax=Trichogramma pretiosum TaxID=7493 RepID=UPI0006C99981|nr:cytochrome c oxidase assembly protein COX11, mitochondrial [Trichogramma pretiosum]XP_023314995.1 cytochrome c oxidase assembly protein COX11, mitochondrial [Trichogramma pretiosum]
MLYKTCAWASSHYARQIRHNLQRNIHSKIPNNEDLERKKRIRSTFNYVTAAGILALGLTYAAVPLYRLFCQAFAYGGTTGHDTSKVAEMKPVKERVLKIKFTADTAAQMAWNFQPQQKEIKLVPGETALAFYTATNPTDVQISGVSTYNIVPFEAGPYFNKIQCFCFEEQMLAPHEQVDMPVFFFIDPEFTEDPKMEFVDEIVLSYTFFEAKEGTKLPIPSYIKKVH